MAAQVFSLFPETNAPATILQKKPPKKEKKKEGYSADFEAFWDSYPRKLNCSKLMAYRAWCNLGLDEQAQSMAAMPIFRRMMRGKEEQYIPHAATWLNQKRFETISVKAAPAPEAPQIDWGKALRIFAATGRWSNELGPEPGKPGFLGPK